MSLDEQVDEYMAGLIEGMHDTLLNKWHEDADDEPDYARGYAAGRAAYLAAEHAERERLSYCPCCDVRQGIGMVCRTPKSDCQYCHGTGKRGT